MLRLRRWRRARRAAALSLLALALVAGELTGVVPSSTAPAQAATTAPLDQQIAEIRREINELAAATPALAADATLATAELAGAAWEFVFGTWCSMADPLHRAVAALDHAESIAPASIKPLVLAVSAEIFRMETFVVWASATRCKRPDVFHVDPTLKPHLASGPDDMDGSMLPIGALADEDGEPTEYVTNQILLETNDTARVTAFINRFGGTRVDTLPRNAAVADSVDLHTIRVDTARLLDTSRLAADLETLDPGYSGEVFSASDQQTLRLLATTARAVVEGYPAQLNLVMRPDDIASGSTQEASPAIDAPDGWDPNAFNWPYMNNNDKQDIEVTTAWQTLQRAGKLKPTFNLGIIDRGFDPEYNKDFPAWNSYVSGALTWGTGQGGKYHGTKVANAFAGQVDNGRGAAGPAGPVVSRLHVVDYGIGTTRGWVRGLRKFINRELNVKIINMSISVGVPQRLAWLTGMGLAPFPVGGLQRELRDVTDGGRMVFASAGNQGENVDRRKCGPLGNNCRERKLRAPCEMDRVICVGGVAWDSKAKATNSNYGASDVDIWAPHNVWVGSDVLCTCSAQMVSGTSFAAPFAARVAALIWTANPSLTRQQVWDTMSSTATVVNSGNVSRLVHAGRAVNKVIPPSIHIKSPTPNQVFASGAPIVGLPDVVTGTKGWPTSFRWTVGSTVVGSNDLALIRLADGTWTIKVTATFSDGTSVNSSVTVTVGSSQPPPTLG